jgi:hypothetical protein
MKVSFVWHNQVFIYKTVKHTRGITVRSGDRPIDSGIIAHVSHSSSQDHIKNG